jgi:hypothetical protein
MIQKELKLFGTYDDFPEIYHALVHLSHRISTSKLQAVILQSLFMLNNEDKNIELQGFVGHNLQTKFDIGIADELTFNFFNLKILNYALKRVNKIKYLLLDFLFIVRYYPLGKCRPLKFDYYMLRFSFNKNIIKLNIFHEKGTRRLAIEDLTRFIIKIMNKELRKKGYNKLKIECLYSV